MPAAISAGFKEKLCCLIRTRIMMMSVLMRTGTRFWLRCPENNVGLILNPGCDVETSRKAVSYANRYPFVYAAVGLHPENIEDGWTDALAEIRRLAKSEPRVRAIGEIGLDYYWEKDERARARQQVVFARQMELARELKMPVIVHDRDAHADCLEITRRYPDVTGVYHCYAGHVEMARELLERGYYLSFTGVITFKNAKKAVEVIREVPIERLMIETDSPYMAPEPYRGRPQFFALLSTAWRSVLRRSRAWRPPTSSASRPRTADGCSNWLKSFAIFC